MKQIRLIIALALLAFVGCETDQALLNPPAPFIKKTKPQTTCKPKAVFDAKNHSIRFGSKEIQVFNSGLISYTDDGLKVSKIYFYANTAYSPWLTNDNINIEAPSKYGKRLGVESFSVDQKTKSFIIRGNAPCHAKGETERLSKYKMIVSLLNNDKVKIRFEYTPIQNAGRNTMNLMWQTANATKYTVDGKVSTFPKKRPKQNQYGTPKKIKIFTEPDSGDFELDVKSKLTAYARSGNLMAFHPRVSKDIPDKRVVELEFTPLKLNAPTGSAEDDLLKRVDALDVAPSPVRNLAHNPYFAQGRNYLTNWHLIYPWLSTEIVSTSEDNPKFGKYCLKISAPPKKYGKGTSFIYSPIPVGEGTYTISLYARATDLPAILGISATSHGYKSYGKKKVSLSKDWKRYNLSFNVPPRICLTTRLGFRFDNGGAIYLDGVQIEKSDKATEFVAPPVSAMLWTSDSGDFIEHGKPIDARLTLSTLDDSVSGKALVTASDIFGTVFYEKTINFNFKKGETPEFDLDLDGKTPDGVHVVKVAFEVNKLKYNDYFRFSVMPFLSNTHKLKNMFANYYNGGTISSDVHLGLENYFRRNMRIGCGSDHHQQYPSKALDKLCEKYNFELLDSHVGARASSQKIKKFFPNTNPKPGHTYFYFSFNKNKFDQWNYKGGILPDYRLCGGWNPEYREKVKKAVAEIVKKASPRRIYEFGAEFAPEIKEDPHYPDLVMAIREGVKSVYPDSLFCEGGCYNMDVGGGVREIDRFLEKVKGKMPIEAIQTHCYTKNILNLEPNFKALVDVVENKHGHKDVKYFFGEGMHYGPYEVPAWGLESANWDGRGWISGTISYDIGWTEKQSAAYFMRSWLIFMTKPNQVISANSSSTNRPGVYNLDLDLRSRVYQKIPNTLGVLLGNVKRFVKDVSFAPDTKCLVWEDEKGRGIAAVWNQEPLVDKGMKQGLMAKADFGSQDVEFFDMMGNKRANLEDNSFPVSPFPFFIRGESGKVNAFVKALAHSEIIGASKPPFRISESLASPSKVNLTLTNTVARDVTGDLVVNGKTRTINMKALAKTAVPVSLKQALAFNKVKKVTVPYIFNYDGKKIDSSFSFEGFAIKPFNGDWNTIPSIPISNKFKPEAFDANEFSAKMQAAWDQKNLYLRVTVKDDLFKHEEYPSHGQRWNNDSLQIFIDSRCSARANNTNTFDEDDYAYTLMPSGDGKSARMFRWRTPDMQLTLGTSAPKDLTFADDIKSTFTRTKDGYIYETAIPARYLLPARLEANYSMGFALFLNDRDLKKNVEHYLTMTPEGTAPYNQPLFYPLMVLSE